jgi:hypothetical protein
LLEQDGVNPIGDYFGDYFKEDNSNSYYWNFNERKAEIVLNLTVTQLKMHLGSIKLI